MGDQKKKKTCVEREREREEGEVKQEIKENSKNLFFNTISFTATAPSLLFSSN